MNNFKRSLRGLVPFNLRTHQFMNPLRQWAPYFLKKIMWDRQFTTGHWSMLEDTSGDFLYSCLQRFLPAGGSILDLGCATGQTARELPPGLCSHYQGVDISSIAITRAREVSPEHCSFCVSDIETFTPARAFDIILFRESLYYIPTVSRALTALRRYSGYLTEGGAFVVRFHDRDKHRLLIEAIHRNFNLRESTYNATSPACVLAF